MKEELTSNSADEDEQEVEGSIEELVLMLSESERKTKSNEEDQLVDDETSNLNIKDP